MAKKKKVRADFRKNREARTRDRDITRRYRQEDFDEDQTRSDERVRSKGQLSRKRTIVTTGEERVDATTVPLAIDETGCEIGRVLTVQGLVSVVESEVSGRQYRCATRRLLKTLSTDQRHVVATGDRVTFRISGEDDGIIERIEPRHGLISRTSRGRQHVIVANVDQLLIVTSAAEPNLKPHLIDRFLVTADSARIRPIICINKIDLVDAASLQPLIGVYAQMGYQVADPIRHHRIRTGAPSRHRAGQAKRRGGPKRRRQVVASERDPAGAGTGGSRGQRRHQQGTSHDDLLPTYSAGHRRLDRGHARHSPIPAVGRDPRRDFGILPRPAAVRLAMPVPRLHAHSRG